MKAWEKSRGLIAATFTPMNKDGSLRIEGVDAMVDYLLKSGVTQVFVNGSAGEHASLTVAERKALAERWVHAGRGKLTRVIIHCGTGNLADTKELAHHAESIGADAVAMVGPTYFKFPDMETLIQYCAEVANCCSNTPFLYYHFPGITGINIRLTDFLTKAGPRIPNLVGAKHTSLDLADGVEASRLFNGKFDVIPGSDTVLVGAFSMGITSAIGISFCMLGKTFGRLCEAFQKGDLKTANEEQRKVQEFWSRTHHQGDFSAMVSNMKAVMNLNGLDIGPTRLPIPTATAARMQELQEILKDLNYADWEK